MQFCDMFYAQKKNNSRDNKHREIAAYDSIIIIAEMQKGKLVEPTCE